MTINPYDKIPFKTWYYENEKISDLINRISYLITTAPPEDLKSILNLENYIKDGFRLEMFVPNLFSGLYSPVKEDSYVMIETAGGNYQLHCFIYPIFFYYHLKFKDEPKYGLAKKIPLMINNKDSTIKDLMDRALDEVVVNEKTQLYKNNLFAKVFFLINGKKI